MHFLFYFIRDFYSLYAAVIDPEEKYRCIYPAYSLYSPVLLLDLHHAAAIIPVPQHHKYKAYHYVYHYSVAYYRVAQRKN